MEHEFWHERWRENQIGFHEGHPNDLLVAHFEALELQAGDRICVPLCGKAIDIDWLLNKGLKVVGIELNEDAVRALYERLGIVPRVEARGALIEFHADQLTVFCGDFFKLDKSTLGPVAAVYDRAALIALPEAMRREYTQHLVDITGKARQLLITIDYEQSQTQGPPFSVSESEIRERYTDQYAIRMLESRAISGPLAKRCQGDELIWLLNSHPSG